jgi:hypothetical protein
MTKRIFLLICLLHSLSIIAQDYQAIDNYVHTIPLQKNQDVALLTVQITKTSKNETEKIRAIFVWVAKNIAYDVKALESGQISEQSVSLVLNSGRAVCEGYSQLFKQMCDYAAIPCEVLKGYSKGYGYTQGKKFLATDHAWNSVKINKNWYLLDATWGSGYVTNDLKFVREYNNSFFLSNPESFILKHLPIDPMWQLLPSPITIKQFEQDSLAIKKILAQKIQSPYNYADTLRYWEKLDSTQRILNENVRCINFNPENGDLYYEISYYYFKQAWQRMNQLNDFSIQKNRAIAVPLAKEAINFQKIALKYLQEAEKRRNNFQYDIPNQKSTIRQNLSFLESFVGK